MTFFFSLVSRVCSSMCKSSEESFLGKWIYVDINVTGWLRDYCRLPVGTETNERHSSSIYPAYKFIQPNCSSLSIQDLLRILSQSKKNHFIGDSHKRQLYDAVK